MSNEKPPRLRNIIFLVKILIVILLGSSFLAYYVNGEGAYKINSRFKPIALNYDPDANTSVYDNQDV